LKISIVQNILDAMSVLSRIQSDPVTLSLIEKITMQCIAAIREGNKILFAGNGGSAADAQHLTNPGRAYSDWPYLMWPHREKCNH